MIQFFREKLEIILGRFQLDHHWEILFSRGDHLPKNSCNLELSFYCTITQLVISILLLFMRFCDLYLI